MGKRSKLFFLPSPQKSLLSIYQRVYSVFRLHVLQGSVFLIARSTQGIHIIRAYYLIIMLTCCRDIFIFLILWVNARWSTIKTQISFEMGEGVSGQCFKKIEWFVQKPVLWLYRSMIQSAIPAHQTVIITTGSSFIHLQRYSAFSFYWEGTVNFLVVFNCLMCLIHSSLWNWQP